MYKKFTPIILVICILLIILFAGFLGITIDYNRWDNFEIFTATYWQAHNQWLDGSIPLWNYHQHLGEPILALSRGALYFPFTIIFLLMRILRLPLTKFPLYVVLLHLPLMALGWFYFLRKLKIRLSISFIGAISISTVGFMTVMSMVWLHFLTTYTWLPWVLLGCIQILTNKKNILGGALLSFGLMLAVYAGHPQQIVYFWLNIILFAIFFSVFVLKDFKKVIKLIPSFIIALLLCAPSLLPMIQIATYSQRFHKTLSVSWFLSREAAKTELFGMFLPLYRVLNSFMPQETSIMLYQGAWVVPAILLGIWIIICRRKVYGKQPDDIITKYILTMTCVTLIFFMFSFGAIIYPLTYWIPVWSSFRWPFKFLFHATSGLGIIASLSLELYQRSAKNNNKMPKIALSVIFISSYLLLFYFLDAIKLKTSYGLVCLFSGLFMLPFMLWSYKRRIGGIFIFLVFVSSVGVTALAHSLLMKQYRDPYGIWGAERFGIDNDYRVLPTFIFPGSDKNYFSMQETGNFHSATINNYYSATGHTNAMAPSWYIQYMPSNLEGIFSGQMYEILLDTYFLKSLNVRYLIVNRHDEIFREKLQQIETYRIINEFENVVVYDNGSTLKRVYFADNLYPFDQGSFFDGMFNNKATLRSAFIEGWNKYEKVKLGQVLQSEWQDGGKIDIAVSAPDGGFLVISSTYYPQWRATVDGKPAYVYRVNGLLKGIHVPPGAKEIKLYYKPTFFYVGLILAVLGLFLFYMRNRNNSRK